LVRVARKEEEEDSERRQRKKTAKEDSERRQRKKTAKQYTSRCHEIALLPRSMIKSSIRLIPTARVPIVKLVSNSSAPT
jgi:hypothetical protein